MSNHNGKIELWFFRDLVDAQRLKLFALFGMPASELVTLGAQKIAINSILKAKTADLEAMVEALQKSSDDFEREMIKVSEERNKLWDEARVAEAEIKRLRKALEAARDDFSLIEQRVDDGQARRAGETAHQGWREASLALRDGPAPNVDEPVILHSEPTPEGGVIRLAKWPEGYVLWFHGEIVWRSWAKAEQAAVNVLRPASQKCQCEFPMVRYGSKSVACDHCGLAPRETSSPPGTQIRTAECDGKDAVPETGLLPVGAASTLSQKPVSDLDIQIAYEAWVDRTMGAHAPITAFYAGYRAALATTEGSDNG